MDWNKRKTLTADEVYKLLLSAFEAKPSKRVKSKSSFKTGVMNGFQKTVEKFQKLYKD